MNSKLAWENGERARLLHAGRKAEFPISMEIIPRQQSFACLSLKFGCVISACILIVYSVLSLAQCTAAIADLAPSVRVDDWSTMITFALLAAVTVIHAVTLSLTAVMLVGTLREKLRLMRPWIVWTSVQVMVYFLMFVFWTVMYMVNHMGSNALLVYFIEFMSLLVRFYMLMLVASYYKQLEEEQYDYEEERMKTLVNNDVWYNTA